MIIGDVETITQQAVIAFDGEGSSFAQEVYSMIRDRGYVVHVIPRIKLTDSEVASHKIERETCWRELQERGGRGVALAERIDQLDRTLELGQPPFDAVVKDVYRGPEGFLKVALAPAPTDDLDSGSDAEIVEFDIAADLEGVIVRY